VSGFEKIAREGDRTVCIRFVGDFGGSFRHDARRAERANWLVSAVFADSGHRNRIASAEHKNRTTHLQPAAKVGVFAAIGGSFTFSRG
jgi:hypothetical protein